MHVLSKAFPQWPSFSIHESSPGWDLVSQRLQKESKEYVASQFDMDKPLGTLVTETRLPCGRYYVEDLERQTFEDARFDLVVTQDVFEHIFDPRKAIAEIARTLKISGATIMSVPVIRKFRPSIRRAEMIDGSVRHILPAEYHGSPVNSSRALVTVDWGYDIASILQEASSLHFVVFNIDDLTRGIRDECNEIVVGFKTKQTGI
jgi:SAM-dependent methyltransferase